MADSILSRDGGRFEPTEHARGPWDPRALHGGAPAALITSAFERMEPGSELRSRGWASSSCARSRSRR
jgi:hypothetical protein